MRTAQLIAEQEAKGKAERLSDAKPKRGMHPNSRKNLVAPWTPETRPKSPGRPRDEAAEISRAAIENNRLAIYNGIVQKLVAGDAYAFSVHADRGYGKLKQGVIHMGDEDGGPVQTSIKVEFVTAEK